MNRPVRTRMQGGVGGGGETPPPTQLYALFYESPSKEAQQLLQGEAGVIGLVDSLKYPVRDNLVAQRGGTKPVEADTAAEGWVGGTQQVRKVWDGAQVWIREGIGSERGERHEGPSPLTHCVRGLLINGGLPIN